MILSIECPRSQQNHNCENHSWLAGSHVEPARHCFWAVAPNDYRTITKNPILGLGEAETGFKMNVVNGHSTSPTPKNVF